MKKFRAEPVIDNQGLVIKGTILCQPELAGQLSPAWFTPAFYGDKARAVSQGGRNAAWFIDRGQDRQLSESLTKTLPRLSTLSPCKVDNQALLSSDRSKTQFSNATQTGETSQTKRTEETLTDKGLGFQAVLRQYRRGGLMAKINRYYYFWQGAEQTRAWAELRLLQQMYQAGLAVPRPLAAVYKLRFGGFYTAAILTQTILNAQTLVEVLQTLLQEKARAQTQESQAGEVLTQDTVSVNPVESKVANANKVDSLKCIEDVDGEGHGVDSTAQRSIVQSASIDRRLEELAERVAKAIVQMHQFGVWHADLNAFNIMVDDTGKVWLLDFDKSERRFKGEFAENKLLGSRDSTSAVSAILPSAHTDKATGEGQKTKQACVDAWQQDNLLRLQRHLLKTCAEPGLAFWSQINDKYQKIYRK